MFEDADNFADIFRGGLPFYVLITIPILLICSSNPVLASSEFNVQRMTQYDLHGNPLGIIRQHQLFSFHDNLNGLLNVFFICFMAFRLSCFDSQFGS